MYSQLQYLKNLSGRNLEPAIQNIINRKINIIEGRNIDTCQKLGIVVEGGAMRAVVSGGSFIALDFLGFNDVFDVIYGSSAGAINAAYFLSHQIAYAVAVYYQLINNKNFIDLKRLFDPRHSSKVVNMDFLFDKIITKERSLDVDKVRSSNTDLYMSVTNVDNGKYELFSNRDLDIELVTALKASSAIPLYYNKSVEINGQRYVDGSVANALPIQEAIDIGCTDILVLLTRPEGYRKKPAKGILRIYQKYKLKPFGSQFVKQYLEQRIMYNKSLDLIYSKEINDNVNISVVTPKMVVNRVSINEGKLKTVTMDGTKRTLHKFGCKDIDVVEVIKPVVRVNYKDDKYFDRHLD